MSTPKKDRLKAGASLSAAHLFSPEALHLPVQPALHDQARDLLYVTINGQSVAWLNAGAGLNPSAIGVPYLHVDPSGVLCDLAREEAEAGTRDTDRTAVMTGAPDPLDLNIERLGHYVQAPATDTGIADASITNLFIERINLIEDREGLAREILRILCPGGRVVSIEYGLPIILDGDRLHTASMIADKGLSTWSGLPLEHMETRTAPLYTELMRGPSRNVLHSAWASAGLPETIAYIMQHPWIDGRIMGGERLGCSYADLISDLWTEDEKLLLFAVHFDGVELR